MKKSLLVGILLCSGLLFGCSNVNDEDVTMVKSTREGIPQYILTFDYEVSKDEAIDYAKDFGEELSKNGLDDFWIDLHTDYGVVMMKYKDGKLILNSDEPFKCRF